MLGLVYRSFEAQVSTVTVLFGIGDASASNYIFFVKAEGRGITILVHS